MTTLSIGKYRGLQQCATERGAVAVFALDHRGNLRRALNPANPDSVSPAEMSAFKQQVVAALAPATSATFPLIPRSIAPPITADFQNPPVCVFIKPYYIVKPDAGP